MSRVPAFRGGRLCVRWYFRGLPTLAGLCRAGEWVSVASRGHGGPFMTNDKETPWPVRFA